MLNRSVRANEIIEGIHTFPDLSKDAWYYEAMVTATNSYLANRAADGHQVWQKIIDVVPEM